MNISLQKLNDELIELEKTLPKNFYFYTITSGPHKALFEIRGPHKNIMGSLVYYIVYKPRNEFGGFYRQAGKIDFEEFRKEDFSLEQHVRKTLEDFIDNLRNKSAFSLSEQDLKNGDLGLENK